MTESNYSEKAKQFLTTMQSDICDAIETIDGKAKFVTDTWTREDSGEAGTTATGLGGGGGTTRVIQNGAVIEKGGVNFSEVMGTLPREMCKTLVNRDEQLPFYATGTSLVIHPFSPMVPTIHANIRYLKVADKQWMGGGIDLTPYVYNEKIFTFFHSSLRDVCNKTANGLFDTYKEECDRYFYIPHRQETRGIGGIFFDYLGRESEIDLTTGFSLGQGLAKSFNDIYIPIVEQTMGLAFSEEQKNFQLVRRGRYVEFNLVYDRGTLFGLKTGGRIESILMSLPLEARWEYDYTPPVGSDQEKLTAVFKNPRNWVSS